MSKLSVKYQLYPKSTKIDAFGLEIYFFVIILIIEFTVYSIDMITNYLVSDML